MPKDYEIIRYSDDFKQEVIEFQKLQWSPHTELNASFLDWKYQQNPYLKEPLIYLARQDGKIVGMRGMVGANWEVGTPARTYLGVCAEDLLIDPAHRNRGLMKEIMRTSFVDLATKGHEYIYSLTALPVTLIGSLAMGFRSGGSFHPQFLYSRRYDWFMKNYRTIGEMKFFWRFAGKIAKWAERRETLPDLCRSHERSRWRRNPNILAEMTPRPEEMDDLIRRIRHDGRIRHVRDREYFSWRFLNPMARYLFLYWTENRLEGYLVLQENITELRNKVQVSIVDWEGTSQRVLSDLLHAAIELYPFPLLIIWIATLGEEKVELLRKVGFRSGTEREFHYPPTLLVRAVRDDMMDTEWSLAGRRLLDMADWDFRMVYSMYV